MKPFYQDKWVTIYHGDCREILPQLPNRFAQMVFADPDFNVGKKYPTHKDNRDDYYGWCKEWINLCFDKLEHRGSFYLMTLTRHLEMMYIYMFQHGVFINEIHWRNVSASQNKRSFWNTYQPILLYGKSGDYIFNTYAQTQKNILRWTSWATGARGQMGDYWADIPFVYSGSIRHKEAILKPMTSRKVHPCQMPLELARRCIMFSTNPDDIAVDPFMGIGAIPFAAKELGRKCIGIEIEEKYCEIAANRCRQEVMELN